MGYEDRVAEAKTVLVASGYEVKKKESEMSDRAVPRITSVIPESADKTPRRDASPFRAQDQIDLLLKDRGSKYGSFDNHAKLTQGLFDIFLAHMQNYNPEGYKKLTDSMRESLHMIFHKLGRIGNGDPEYADSWVDGAGYFKLQADILQQNEAFDKIEKDTSKYPSLAINPKSDGEKFAQTAYERELRLKEQAGKSNG